MDAIYPTVIAVALGRSAPALDSAEYAQWELLIEDALMLIERRRAKVAPDLTLDEQILRYVVREAVIAHLRRPDDATQVSTTADDTTTMRTYQSGTGRVSIKDEWWELLGLTAEGGQAFDVDTVPCRTAHVPWCSLLLGAAYCSCGVDIAGAPIYETGDWL